MEKILEFGDDPGAWLRGRKRLLKKPLSAQAKPGRPSGVDKKEFSERAHGRARGEGPGVHRQRLVCVFGHVRLALRG
jgi:hypothetical protein